MRFSLSAKLSGPTRLMSPMVGKAMRSEVRNLERLREVLEARGPTAGGAGTLKPVPLKPVAPSPIRDEREY